MTPDGATVLLHAQDRGRRNLYALPIDGGPETVPRLLAPGGATGDVAAAGNGLAVFVRQSFHRPADLWTVALDGAGSSPRPR